MVGTRPAPTRLRVAGSAVGVVGLAEIFGEVADLGLPEGAARRQELLRRFEVGHYVPEPAREEYAAALGSAYRTWSGEGSGEAGPGPEDALRVAVLGPGCAACERLLEEVRQALAESGAAAEVEHVRDPSALLEYGLVAYPALVVNGVVRVSGRRPTPRQLREILAGSTAPRR